ncbi:hypothetical protein R50073_31860 [Maricurvus nonylphenolicus]|uniref:hypothetical protein n=1 Tax=Maricurvus nonylphenolicus TaxID=1008307 RepID=UPI0036F28DA7
MTFCICLLQEGQIPEDTVKQLGEGLEDIVVRNGLGEKLDISWVKIPKGEGWTAGQLSTSSIVTLMAPPIEQDLRVDVLNAICNLWTDKTDCHINEIIATVMPAT